MDCSCAEFPAVGPAHDRGPAHVWLQGQAGIRRALNVLWTYARDGLLYHGGVHVDGAHVLAIFADDGRELYPHKPQFPTVDDWSWRPWVST